MAERSITVRVVGDTKDVEEAFRRAGLQAQVFESKLESTGKRMSSIGSTATKNVTVPLLAVGAAGVKMAQDFDLTISRLQGLAGVSAKQAAEWRTQLLQLAPIVGKAPAELAEGLYQIASSGVPAAKAMQILTLSAKASTAGMGETATVADALTSVMNAYKGTSLTAAQAMDILTTAVKDGKGEASDFAPVIGKVVAVGSQMGVSFNDIAAALARMTQFGVPAEDAATQLSATFSEMLKVTPKAEKALEAVGLSGAQLRQELREKGLLATLQDLEDRFHGNTVAMAEAFPNVRALRGVLQLLGGDATETSRVFDDTKNATGALSTAWKAASDTDAVKMQQAIADVKVAAIQLGESLAPVAREVAHDVGGIAHAFNELSPAQREVLTRMAEAAAIGGPVVLLTGKIVTMAAAIEKSVKSMKEMRLATLALGNPEIVAALAALVFGFEAVSKLLEHDSHVTQIKPGTPGGGAQGGTVFQRGGQWYQTMVGGKAGAVTRPITTDEALRLLGGPTSAELTSAPGGSSLAQLTQGSVAAAQERAIVGFARQYGPSSGVVYHWGGVSPITGFDCSGYLYAAYAAAGITIPRDTRSQWNDPKAIHVPPGQEQPGDGVYFHGSLTGKNAGPPPGHVGIYIGGGKYIEYFSEGKPAKIANLADAGDYMGARRWLKLAGATGGGSRGGDTGGNTGADTTPTTTKKAGTTTGDALLPSALRASLEAAKNKATESQGAVALKALEVEKEDLEKAQTYLANELKKSGLTAKQKTAIENEQRSIASRLAEVNKSITSNLKQQADAIKSSFSSTLSSERSAISSAASKIKDDLDAQLAAQLQSYIDTVLGPKFFQGTDTHGVQLQTPEEKAYADFQAAQDKKQREDALAQARKQLELDRAKSDVTADQLQQDEAAVQAAEDANTANDLATKATASRAQADYDYAQAVKAAQLDEQERQKKLDDQLDAWSKGLQDGTTSISDLASIAQAFGLSLADPTTGVAADFDSLSAAVVALASTMLAEAGKLAAIGDVKDSSAIDSAAQKLGVTSAGGGLVAGIFGSEGYFKLNPIAVPKLATGGDIDTDGFVYVHAGERVLPASVVRNGGGRGGPTTIILEVDGQELARATAPYTDGDVRIALR
jgi:TP901 family phage tail tape measure protein